MKRVALIVCGVLLGALLLLNPNKESFEEYIGSTNTMRNNASYNLMKLGRTSNYFILSTYEHQYSVQNPFYLTGEGHNMVIRAKYIAVAGNFFSIKTERLK